DKPIEDVKSAYRAKLWQVLHNGCCLSDKIVINSGEGIGKTSEQLQLMAYEAQDDNCTAPEASIERFSGFSFRSRQQAERKAEEFRKAGYSIMIWRSFWDHYEAACLAEKQKIISRDEFTDANPKAIHLKIRAEQPSVFERLEQVRKGLWASSAAGFC